MPILVPKKVGASMSSNEDLKWSLDTQTLDEVAPQRLAWLWPEKIPAGKITLFSGNPDCGKTTLLSDLIARFTSGRPWPDQTANHSNEYTHGPRRSVLLLNAEDDLADTLVPRLHAAKAVLRLIHIASGARLQNCQPPSFIGLDNLEPIEQKLRDHPEIALMVVDPIQSYLGEGDLNKEQSVRAILTPLAELAAKHEVTIILNSHLSKRGDVNALHRVGGAVALSAVSRAAWLICRDHEDKTLHRMLLAKGNLSRKRTGMKFRINSVETSVGSQPVIGWEGPDETDVEDAVRQPERESKLDQAIAFLEQYLTEPRLARDVEANALKHGIGERTLASAKQKLSIKSSKRAGKWFWEKAKDANE